MDKHIKKIRNFSIIAHIDHGKSTLADRMLEKTGTVERRNMKDRLLDTLELEQERGITIKLQTVRMHHKEYVLNLIDTPGHVDFSYEVSRALAACEGCIILVDATQGIQAQTLSTYYQALESDLAMIPVINKIDLPNAEVDRVRDELVSVFGFSEDEIILTSGKTGEGVENLLDTIVAKIPPPEITETRETKALVFDSFYHEHKGVVALVRIFEGQIPNDTKITFFATKTSIKPVEIGYLTPNMIVSEKLSTGEVGYIATGLKDINKITTGDTVTLANQNTSSFAPLSGYRKPKPMVYAGFYPADTKKQEDFREAIEQLGLNDSAFSFKPDSSPALGFGYRCGFLGLLHLEIIQERLSREFDLEIIITAPTVEFAIPKTPTQLTTIPINEIDPKEFKLVNSALDITDREKAQGIFEPICLVEILTPDEYIGSIMELCTLHRGKYITTEYLLSNNGNNSRKKYVLIKYEIPLSEIITDFFDKLKSVSSGYASLDYNVIKYELSEMVRLDFLINHEIVEPLTLIVHESNARRTAIRVLEKLKESIPRQQFKIPLQATIGGKIIAREDIKAYRKDVTAKLYGGDITRKKKLLEKQKKGKKRMSKFGKVEIPQEAFLSTLKR